MHIANLGGQLGEPARGRWAEVRGRTAVIRPLPSDLSHLLLRRRFLGEVALRDHEGLGELVPLGAVIAIWEARMGFRLAASGPPRQPENIRQPILDRGGGEHAAIGRFHRAHAPAHEGILALHLHAFINHDGGKGVVAEVRQAGGIDALDAPLGAGVRLRFQGIVADGDRPLGIGALRADAGGVALERAAQEFPDDKVLLAQRQLGILRAGPVGEQVLQPALRGLQFAPGIGGGFLVLPVVERGTLAEERPVQLGPGVVLVDLEQVVVLAPDVLPPGEHLRHKGEFIRRVGKRAGTHKLRNGIRFLSF